MQIAGCQLDELGLVLVVSKGPAGTLGIFVKDVLKSGRVHNSTKSRVWVGMRVLSLNTLTINAGDA
jgi:hypothetical protein